MANKLPQPTINLIRRLRRVAKKLDERAGVLQGTDPVGFARQRAHANTCWQAAARLEELAACVEELTPVGARVLEEDGEDVHDH